MSSLATTRAELTAEVESLYFARHIPDDERIRAIAEEAALTDRDLDGIEARMLASDDAGEVTALALTIARCGRRSSAKALRAARQHATTTVDQTVLDLALELLTPRPRPAYLQRADEGYRFTPGGGVELFVEDALAAYWHHRDRWGPPLRPHLDGRWSAAGQGDRVEALAADALDGGIIVVTFQPGRLFGGPQPALRLTCAGFARDAALRSMVRFGDLSSVGVVTKRKRRLVAYEVRGEALTILPPKPSIPVDDLVALMGRLLQRARGG